MAKDRRDEMKEYYLKNRERILKRQKEHYHKHLPVTKRITTEEHRQLMREKRKEYVKNYNETHKERCAETHKKNRQLERIEVLAYYSKGTPICECCGESHMEFLGIDHINGGGSKHRKESNCTNIYRLLKKNNFPEGYRVLCHNCNLSIGFYGYCPHQV